MRHATARTSLLLLSITVGAILPCNPARAVEAKTGEQSCAVPSPDPRSFMGAPVLVHGTVVELLRHDDDTWGDVDLRGNSRIAIMKVDEVLVGKPVAEIILSVPKPCGGAYHIGQAGFAGGWLGIPGKSFFLRRKGSNDADVPILFAMRHPQRLIALQNEVDFWRAAWRTFATPTINILERVESYGYKRQQAPGWISVADFAFESGSPR